MAARAGTIERTIGIRGGLPNRDLGYPCTVMAKDGSLFTVYYGQESDGVTCIMATRWRLCDQIGFGSDDLQLLSPSFPARP